MLWKTQDGGLVTVGDTVALGLAGHANAVGRIMAATEDGRIECLLVSCESCAPGGVVTVEEDQLLLRLQG